MADAAHTHSISSTLPGASYGATTGAFSRRGTVWGASVFLLAGALIVLSVMFGSNDDSSSTAPSAAVVVETL